MDELDRKIIALLQQNGRTSNARIARQVGVSEGTVRRRLKRLLQDGIARIIAVPSAEKLGYQTTALIGLQVDPDKIEAVADRLAHLDEAQYVAVTTGTYDIFLSATLPHPEDLATFLRTKVAPIKGVRRTETFINLTIKKQTYGVKL